MTNLKFSIDTERLEILSNGGVKFSLGSEDENLNADEKTVTITKAALTRISSGIHTDPSVIFSDKHVIALIGNAAGKHWDKTSANGIIQLDIGDFAQ